MRAPSITLLALVCAGALGACTRPHPPGEAASTPIASVSADARKAGLWEQRVSDGESVHVTQICLDAASDITLSDYGRQANAQCEKHEVKEAGTDAWRFETVCDSDAGKVTTQGEVRGDTATHYTTTAESTVQGVRRRLVAEASWKGACPAGMKAGDVIFPDGRRLTVADLAPVNG